MLKKMTPNIIYSFETVPQRSGKETRGTGDQKKNRDYQDHGKVEYWGESGRPKEICNHSDSNGKRPGKTGMKNTQAVI